MHSQRARSGLRGTGRRPGAAHSRGWTGDRRNLRRSESPRPDPWLKSSVLHRDRIEAVANDAMKTNRPDPIAWRCAILLLSACSMLAGDPLPEFTFQGVALHPTDLAYAPTQQLIHPSIIRTHGRIEDPLGEFYLYYAPHKHVAISMAYADSLDGPWTEYRDNPVIEGPSAPDIRWIEDKGRFYMWGHTKNSRTELWTSRDGIRFEHRGVSITAANIGTRNATYTRVYEYPLERYGSRFVMPIRGSSKEERFGASGWRTPEMLRTGSS